MNLRFICFIILLSSFGPLYAQSPCVGAIFNFPYVEDFEATNGNWVPGGIASDWVWGTPAKPIITGAGQGAKSWIVGGRTNSSYNNGERSFLKSPCFNLSSLTNPRISFKVFWETEKKFDGAAFEYSTDGGNSWTLLGTSGSDANCNGSNWYNNSNITYLSGSNGWSGNIQTNGCGAGSGSGGWLTATHTLSSVAGQTSVQFRFVFGAGTICNAFDGFAIDDVKIFNAPPNNSDFSYTCRPARAVDFAGPSLCTAGTSWTFGDIGSGVNNTSADPNPAHIFSAPGPYTVTLTTIYHSGPPSTVSKQITVLDVTANQDQSISCKGGQTATISASAAGSTSPYSYVWNTNPVQSTRVVSNAGAGSYTVTVLSGTACPTSATVIVIEPPLLQLSPVATPQKCLTDNGGIVSHVTGGTPGYTFLWSNGSSTADLNGLAAGNYSLQVTDTKGCMADTNNIIIASVQDSLNVNLGAEAFICPGEKLILNAGNFASYVWQDNSTAQHFSVTATGTYSVTVTDAKGCTGTGSIKVTVDCSDINFPTAFTPNGDGKNDLFGPAGNNLSVVKNYRLDISNRFGETVFLSTDPYHKWNGSIKGTDAGLTTFVWKASYTLNGNTHFKKGSVILIK